MDPNLNLDDRHYELQEMLSKAPGVKKVYFQPPTSIKLEYPCIILSRDGGSSRFADGRAYRFTRRYSVQSIDMNPDSEIPDWIAKNIPMCTMDQHYTSENLYHDSFTVYY